MATKKATATKSAAAPAGIPAMLLEGNMHSYIAKAKAAVARKASLTRTDPVFAAVDLAWYLTALGRSVDARPVLDWIIAGVAFNGNYNLWLPAAVAICLRARIARDEGDEALRSALVARLVKHPSYATVERARLDEWVLGRIRPDIDSAMAETAQKSACLRLARALVWPVYFRETAGSGFYYDDWIVVAALDAEIDRALWLLRQRLG